MTENKLEVQLSPGKKAIIFEYFIAMLFILPSVLIVIYMVFYPIINSVYISFFNWNGIAPNMEYVGLENFKYVFTDMKFARSLYNNFIWMVLHILLACIYGLVLAYMISRLKKGYTLFRSVLFMPNVVALSVSAIMWTMVYNTKYGMLIMFLKILGIDTSNLMLLSDQNAAIYAVAVAANWQGYGYYMVLFLAGIQNIDIQLYEAADIDGAGSWQKFINVTIPGLSNVFTFVVSIAIINGLRGFATVWVMTEGGPGYSTYLVAVYGYIKAFRELNMGQAMVSALAIGMVILCFTILFNFIREKRLQDN